MKNFLKIFIVSLLLIWGAAANGYAQYVPPGFTYQTTVREATGVPVINQTVRFRFSFLTSSSFGPLVWEEEHLLTTDAYGHVLLTLGSGISSGAGSASSFNQIAWSAAPIFLKVSIDISGGTSFMVLGATQLFSVPYAFHSSTTIHQLNQQLAELYDVNAAGNGAGKLLKWNGVFWVPASDNHSDTVLYAYNAASAIHTDTSLYSYSTLNSDTVLFAYTSDSTFYSAVSNIATTTVNAGHSDTALYALSSPAIAWKINGNAVGVNAYAVGTNDNSDFKMNTNGSNRLTVKSSGEVGLGTSLNSSSLRITNDNGLFSTGTFGSTYIPVDGSGTRLVWYPSNGSFRAGRVMATQWDTANTGEYSMAFGLNTKARVRSFASGFESESVDYSFTSGRRCSAMPVGPYPSGNSISLGDSCQGLSYRDVTIGKNNYVVGGINIVMGYGNLSPSNQSVCIGSSCNVVGNRSTVFGYHGATSNLKGGFVFADASSSAATTPSIAFQFVVRSIGGVVFYSDSTNTTGVTIFPGSGSWSVVSDVHKKENALPVDDEAILRAINELKIVSWNYKSQSKSIRHIGPMAQDFYEKFHVGENNVSISSIDIDGVILSGIKALSKNMEEVESNLSTLDALKLKVKTLENTAILNERLDAIEAALKK